MKIKIKKNTLRILLIIFLLLISLGCLYYYFFIKLDTNWVFWKKDGEEIDWDNIQYDKDFFPKDMVEVYGEYGEWKFKEFRPIYAGYGSTEDGLNYLVGKYLDDNSKEKTVKILVSGEGMPKWPFPDSGFREFYDSYYKERIAIRGDNDPEPVYTFDNFEYSTNDEFFPLPTYELYSCPKELILTTDEVNKYVSIAKDLPGYYFVELNNYYTYCNPYKMFYNSYPAKILVSFEDLVKKLKIGKQFSVKYLESAKSFDECRYDYDNYQKIFCANQYLNEKYKDDFLVGIYIILN